MAAGWVLVGFPVFCGWLDEWFYSSRIRWNVRLNGYDSEYANGFQSLNCKFNDFNAWGSGKWQFEGYPVRILFIFFFEPVWQDKDFYFSALGMLLTEFFGTGYRKSTDTFFYLIVGILTFLQTIKIFFCYYNNLKWFNQDF